VLYIGGMVSVSRNDCWVWLDCSGCQWPGGLVYCCHQASRDIRSQRSSSCTNYGRYG